MSRPPNLSIKDRNDAICSAIIAGETPKEVAYRFQVEERLVRTILTVCGIKKRYVQESLVIKNEVIKT